jgi:flagellar biosynthesis protein FliP
VETSTNLKSHLKRHHPEHYNQLEDDRELQNEKNQKHQRVLHEFMSKNQQSNQIKHYSSNSARCK